MSTENLNSSILVCGGCSYTGGGGFNNPIVFKNEFKEVCDISSIGELDWSNPKFTNVVKENLWPEILKSLTNHDSVYNCSIGGLGPDSTMKIIIDLIHKLREENPDSKIDLIYQIPESAREEIWYEEYGRPICLLTNLDDDNSSKKYYYTHFFNDEYSFFKQIHQLYRFKKLCKLLDINLYLFCWDGKFIKYSDNLKKLKRKIKFDGEHENNKFWNYHVANVYELKKDNIDDILDYLDIIHFDNYGLYEYSLKNCDIFTFKDKYNNLGIQDTHACKEGMEFIAKTLFDKIFK